MYAAIQEGEYDAGLKWPLVGEVTVTLLNQCEDKNHITTKIPFNTDDNTCVGDYWGYDTFIPHSTLAHDPVKNTQYLKDDALYFRVEVEVTGRKRWLTISYEHAADILLKLELKIIINFICTLIMISWFFETLPHGYVPIIYLATRIQFMNRDIHNYLIGMNCNT